MILPGMFPESMCAIDTDSETVYVSAIMYAWIEPEHQPPLFDRSHSKTQQPNSLKVKQIPSHVFQNY